MKQRYGLPYKGSKSKFANEILEHLPPAKVFYDLFAGGCAITHAAMLSGKWDKVVANDIAAYPILFRDAIRGKYRNDYRWVSREEFFKDDDPFNRLIFSFGNDCRSYLYAEGDKCENLKRALHYAICFYDYQPLIDLGGPDLSEIDSCRTMKQRRLKAYSIIGGKKWYDADIHLENLERLERVQNLERLERLNAAQLEVLQGQYFDVPIVQDSVIYIDPPYIGTNGYGKKHISDFDMGPLYNWIERQTVPVYISEYQMPEDRFECIWEKKTISLMNADSPTEAIERLFVAKGKDYIKTTLF